MARSKATTTTTTTEEFNAAQAAELASVNKDRGLQEVIREIKVAAREGRRTCRYYSAENLGSNVVQELHNRGFTTMLGMDEELLISW